MMRTTKAKFPSVGKTSGGGSGITTWVGAEYRGRYAEQDWRSLTVGVKGKIKFWAYSGTGVGQTITIRAYDNGSLLFAVPLLKNTANEPISLELVLTDNVFAYLTEMSDHSAKTTMVVKADATALTGNITITADGPRDGTGTMFTRLEYQN